MKTIRIAHSPDADDAFMFYGLAIGKVDPAGYRFEHVLVDIQTLNERAETGEYEVSAISFAAYPYVAGKYALLTCGASMGDGYGPVVVSREPLDVKDLFGRRVGVPGLKTSAYLALSLLTPGFTPVVLPFDAILDEVKAGKVDAGLIIHEGQITYGKANLALVVDLGVWWKRSTRLPLPLGGNVIRRDIDTATAADVKRLIKSSIEYALSHRAEAVKYAMGFGRGLDAREADRFIGWYVNEWTLDLGDKGRASVELFLRKAHQRGLIPAPGNIDWV